MSPRAKPSVRLPADLDDIAGLRAARWTRESTGNTAKDGNAPTGQQWDAFGPAAQRELQDRAIRRYELVDATVADPTLDYRVAHSGRTVAVTPQFNAMLGAAGTRFDLLLVPYCSRFARDLETAVNARKEMHARGAVLLFCRERLLSSDEESWTEWAQQSVESESYSRKLSTALKEGHAAKRRTLGEPGGHPPFGFKRDGGKPSRLVEVPDRAQLVVRIFQWAAEGRTDREVAVLAGLKKSHVSEVLTNRIYAGVLSDGSRRVPLVDESVWGLVQDLRILHSRRHRGPVSYRPYALSGLLECRACRRRIIGHSGRYRHTEACEPFRRARPYGADQRGKGESYVSGVYDGIVEATLARLTLNASLVAEVQSAVAATDAAPVNQVRLKRIERERAAAMTRLAADRNTAAWKIEWERLDREDAEARATVPTRSISPRDVAAHLADLRRLFSEAEPATQHQIAQALFDRIEVLGATHAWIHPSAEAEARGLGAAFSGEFRIELRQTGRGERI